MRAVQICHLKYGRGRHAVLPWCNVSTLMHHDGDVTKSNRARISNAIKKEARRSSKGIQEGERGRNLKRIGISFPSFSFEEIMLEKKQKNGKAKEKTKKQKQASQVQ